MKVIIALSVAAVASAAPDNCVVANEFAAANAGNCDVFQACYELASNKGFNNDGWQSNSGFDVNDAFASNTGFDEFNMGHANDGMVANDGHMNMGFDDVNMGFANDGAMNNGFESNSGFEWNMGFENNFGFANEGYFADMCLSLMECGAFADGGAFATCTGATATETATATEEAAFATPTVLICEDVFIGDGVCDQQCNTAEYSFDGGDCSVPTTTTDMFDQATETATPM